MVVAYFIATDMSMEAAFARLLEANPKSNPKLILQDVTCLGTTATVATGVFVVIRVLVSLIPIWFDAASTYYCLFSLAA